MGPRLIAHLAWRRWWGALACVLALALTGCAAPTAISPQVRSHGQWPAGRLAGAFVFERLPSQQESSAQQSALEAAALPALQQAGFTLAAPGTEPAYTVQLGAQARVERQHWSRFDPFWDPHWGPFWPAPWGPYRNAPWNWPGPFPPGPGVWMAPPPPPPQVRMQVDVLIRDRQGGQVLHEAHARHDRVGSVNDGLWPALFRAALARFPTPLPEAVDIEVPLPPPGP